MGELGRPMARGDGEDGNMWHYIHDHEKRMQLLERDSHDIKKSMRDMTVSLAVANKALDGMDGKFLSLEERFKTDLTSQFLLHESREIANQRRTLIWAVGVLLAAIGGFAAWFLDRVALVSGG